MEILLQGLFLLLACAYGSHQDLLRAKDIVVVVLSQPDYYHHQLSYESRSSIHQQATALGEEGPNVLLTHEVFPYQPGTWTVISILPKLHEMVGSNSSWVVFCEERTRFNLPRLVDVLHQHNHTKELWLGHGLYDHEPTIIHHFAYTEGPNHFLYPLLPAGFVMSATLLKRLASATVPVTKSDFTIDATYELATFVQTPLLSEPSVFCLENKADCASYPLPFTPCGDPVPNEGILFAVKTCLKHHKDRVPVVLETWGKEARNLKFFSDVADKSIPTRDVGVLNTARGHCAKTLAILKQAQKYITEKTKWVFLVDDDTLVSVPRLQKLLSCWDGESAVVGERYGYNVHKYIHNVTVIDRHGYNYPTGGAGIAIPRELINTLTANCHCQADDSPDDMTLGFCFSNFHMLLVHCPFFHQARPADYAPSYLATQMPVTFHKHWNLDPVATYHNWLSSSENLPNLHNEL